MVDTTLQFSWVLGLFVLLFLLLLSAFFSGSETALMRAKRVRLQTMEASGNRGATAALRLLKKPEQVLSTILLGNNFVNIAASALATTIFVHIYGDVGIFYATVVMTVVVLVFSEILPKSIAIVHAERVATYAATPLHGLQLLLRPIIALLMFVIERLQKLLKVSGGAEHIGFNHQELVSIIDSSAEHGLLDQAREQMLTSSLQLHEVTLKSLMTPRKQMLMLDASDTVASCRAKAIAQPHSRYPVFHQSRDHLLGIIHIRDLFKLKDKHGKLADSLIWREPQYVPLNRNALSQLFDFQAKRQHMAIVVDEFGDIEGLITLEDIIEEIVGEIVDESDVPTIADIWPQPDGSLVVSGTANVHDINAVLDVDLPESSAATIGGLIVHVLGDTPKNKLCMLLGGVHLEIISVKKGQVQRVRIWEEVDAEDDEVEK